MFYNFKKAKDAALPDELFIDGEIASEQSWFGDGGEIIAKEFRQKLKNCGDIIVNINSPGGDVFAGAEIYTALRDHPGRVTVKILGIAASAASVVAMAGDTVLMSPVAYMMVHNPWTFAVGDYKEMEHTAVILKEIGEGIIQAYTNKTGKTREAIALMLESETYMSAQTAIDEGFADGLLFAADPVEKENKKTAPMKASRYGPKAVCAMLLDQEAPVSETAATLSTRNFPTSTHTHTLPQHSHGMWMTAPTTVPSEELPEEAPEELPEVTADALPPQAADEAPATSETTPINDEAQRDEIIQRAQIIAENTQDI